MRKREARCTPRLLLPLLLALTCFFAVYSEDAQPQELTLQELSSSIREKLIDLKRQSDDMTMQLATLSQDLENSRAEASQWEEQSKTLSSSLMSINDELTQSYSRLAQYEERLRARAKIIAVLAAVAAARLAGAAAALVLMAKGVKTPRIIDILL